MFYVPNADKLTNWCNNFLRMRTTYETGLYDIWLKEAFNGAITKVMELDIIPLKSNAEKLKSVTFRKVVDFQIRMPQFAVTCVFYIAGIILSIFSFLFCHIYSLCV